MLEFPSYYVPTGDSEWSSKQATSITSFFDANLKPDYISYHLHVFWEAFNGSSISEFEYYLRMGDFFWNNATSRLSFVAYKQAKKLGDLPDMAQERLAAIKKSPFRDKLFVITGDFEIERSQALFEIRKCGGMTADSASNLMDVLLIGDQNWSADHGGIATSKVKKAEELQKKGRKVQILTEEDFKGMLRAVCGAYNAYDNNRGIHEG
jgi:NAD-dependent DNA ligase